MALSRRVCRFLRYSSAAKKKATRGWLRAEYVAQAVDATEADLLQMARTSKKEGEHRFDLGDVADIGLCIRAVRP